MTRYFGDKEQILKKDIDYEGLLDWLNDKNEWICKQICLQV